MTPDPRQRRPTIIPAEFGDDDDAQPVLHRAATVIEGYRPPAAVAPAPPKAAPRPSPAAQAKRRPPAAKPQVARSVPKPDQAPRPVERKPAADPLPNSFLGLGLIADVAFGVLLSVVFATGIGIGAALVLP